MCPALKTPGPAEHLAATLRGVAARAVGNRPAGIAVSLILALLADLFARLADLIGRIEAGEYRPPPQAPREAPREAQSHATPPRRRERAQKYGQRHAAPHGAGGVFGQPGTAPRNPEMTAPLGAAPAPTGKTPRLNRRASRPPPPAIWPAITGPPPAAPQTTPAHAGTLACPFSYDIRMTCGGTSQSTALTPKNTSRAG